MIFQSIKLQKLTLIFVLLSALFSYRCSDYTEPDYTKLNQLISPASEATVAFNDNYNIDSQNNDQVASIRITQGTFDKEFVSISFHVYSFQLLNEELTKRAYAMQSYVGKDVNKTFVYFMAQEYQKEFIALSKKELEIVLNFKGLKSTRDFFLYRIKVPVWFEKPLSKIKTATGYTQNDLYYLISGRESANSATESLAKGETNLMNWELVENATVIRAGENAKVNFSTSRFDYIYCLAAHSLPFPVVQDISKRQQGISIIKGDTLRPSNAASPVDFFVYATLQTEPIQEYYYKKLKLVKKGNDALKYKFLGVYASNTVKLPLEILEQITDLYPNDTITNISLREGSKFEVLVNGLVNNFDNNGNLISRRLRLPAEVLAKLNLDFGWYDQFLYAETEKSGNVILIKAVFKTGAILYMTSDYQYYKIENPLLNENYFFMLTIYTNSVFNNISSEITSIAPFIENGETVRYIARLKNEGLIIFDKDGRFIEMSLQKTIVDSPPLTIVNQLFDEYPKKYSYGLYQCFSPDGKSFFKIQMEDGKLFIFDASSYLKVYEQSIWNVLPTPIATAIARDYAGWVVYEVGYFLINNRAALEVDFGVQPLQNSAHSVIYDFNGIKLGETNTVEFRLLPEATKANILKVLPYYTDNQPAIVKEVYNIQTFYILWSVENQQNFIFNKNGMFMMKYGH